LTRCIQLNDAHIFCTLDQVADEAASALALIGAAYRAMGISGARYRLSLPGVSGQIRCGTYVAAKIGWPCPKRRSKTPFVTDFTCSVGPRHVASKSD